MISGGQLPGLPGSTNPLGVGVGGVGGMPGTSGLPGMPGQPGAVPGGVAPAPAVPGQPGTPAVPGMPGQQGAVTPGVANQTVGSFNVDTFCANLGDDEMHKCMGYVNSGMAASLFAWFPYRMTQIHVYQIFQRYRTPTLRPEERELINNLNRSDQLAPALNGKVALSPQVAPGLYVEQNYANLKLIAGQLMATPLLDTMAVAGAFECGGIDWYCKVEEYQRAVKELTAHGQPMHELVVNNLYLCMAVYKSLNESGERAKDDEIAKAAHAGAAILGLECGQLNGMQIQTEVVAAQLHNGYIELDMIMRRGQREEKPVRIGRGDDSVKPPKLPKPPKEEVAADEDRDTF